MTGYLLLLGAIAHAVLMSVAAGLIGTHIYMWVSEYYERRRNKYLN